MTSVILRPNESQDALLKRFRKKVVKSGVLSTVRRKRWFISKSETRRMEKTYLAVVEGVPKQPEWTCRLSLAPVPGEPGRMRTDTAGKEAETKFRAMQMLPGAKPRTLVEARPYTGRTHQIRVHLAESGLPIAGDPLYGRAPAKIAPEDPYPMGLRAIELVFQHPFTRRPVRIAAPAEAFLRRFGFV